MFVHNTRLIGPGLTSLPEGARVVFDVEERKEMPTAFNVQLAATAAAPGDGFSGRRVAKLSMDNFLTARESLADFLSDTGDGKVNLAAADASAKAGVALLADLAARPDHPSKDPRVALDAAKQAALDITQQTLPAADKQHAQKAFDALAGVIKAVHTDYRL
jgi:hypothetical protein